MDKIIETKAISKIESLLNKNEYTYSRRWQPTSISAFEEDLKRGDFFGMNKELRKNIAYSLQYLQYLQIQLEELKLHSIIEKQLQKSYIIIALSVIEGVFWHLVKSKGFEKTSKWETLGRRETNPFKEDGAFKKYEIETFRKLETPRVERMDFEYLISKVQEKKLIDINYKSFPYLKEVKKIRNKVHLFITRFENDTDYLGIDPNDYTLARYLLFVILRSKTFDPVSLKDSSFGFICPSKDRIEELREVLKRNKEKKEQATNNSI